MKNEIVTVETFFTSGTDLAATYFVLTGSERETKEATNAASHHEALKRSQSDLQSHHSTFKDHRE